MGTVDTQAFGTDLLVQNTTCLQKIYLKLLKDADNLRNRSLI